MSEEPLRFPDIGTVASGDWQADGVCIFSTPLSVQSMPHLKRCVSPWAEMEGNISGRITESNIGTAILTRFEAQVCPVDSDLDFGPDGAAPARSIGGNVILVDRLRKAITSLCRAKHHSAGRSVPASVMVATGD